MRCSVSISSVCRLRWAYSPTLPYTDIQPHVSTTVCIQLSGLSQRGENEIFQASKWQQTIQAPTIERD